MVDEGNTREGFEGQAKEFSIYLLLLRSQVDLEVVIFL